MVHQPLLSLPPRTMARAISPMRSSAGTDPHVTCKSADQILLASYCSFMQTVCLKGACLQPDVYAGQDCLQPAVEERVRSSAYDPRAVLRSRAARMPVP